MGPLWLVNKICPKDLFVDLLLDKNKNLGLDIVDGGLYTNKFEICPKDEICSRGHTPHVSNFEPTSHLSY